VDGSKITIQPKHEDLKDDPLDFQANELKKYFRQVTIILLLDMLVDCHMLYRLEVYKGIFL